MLIRVLSKDLPPLGLSQKNKALRSSIAVMSRKPVTSKTTLIHVQPRPESRESDFEVISMDDASRAERNVQFDDVVIYGNPDGERRS